MDVVPDSDRLTSSVRIDRTHASRDNVRMKKLVFFCDSSIYIQTVDEEPAEKPAE